MQILRGVCVAGMSALVAGCGASLNRVVTSLGFTPINPPSTLYPPGTIVQVVSKSPLVVKPVCFSQAAYGTTLTLTKSRSATETWTSKTKTSFTFDANATNSINASLGGKYVKSVTFQLSNPLVYVIDGATIDNALSTSHPSSGCVANIQTKMDAKRPMTVIDSVLQADVTYTIEYDNDTTASAHADASQLTHNIALQLGFENASTGTSTISGTALYWGATDDSDLFTGYIRVAGIQGPAVLMQTQKGLRGALSEIVTIPGAMLHAHPAGRRGKKPVLAPTEAKFLPADKSTES